MNVLHFFSCLVVFSLLFTYDSRSFPFIKFIRYLQRIPSSDETIKKPLTLHTVMRTHFFRLISSVTSQFSSDLALLTLKLLSSLKNFTFYLRTTIDWNTLRCYTKQKIKLLVPCAICSFRFIGMILVDYSTVRLYFLTMMYQRERKCSILRP